MKTEQEILELRNFHKSRIVKAVDMMDKFKDKPAEYEWRIRLNESIIKVDVLNYILDIED